MHASRKRVVNKSNALYGKTEKSYKHKYEKSVLFQNDNQSLSLASSYFKVTNLIEGKIVFENELLPS